MKRFVLFCCGVLGLISVNVGAHAAGENYCATVAVQHPNDPQATENREYWKKCKVGRFEVTPGKVQVVENCELLGNNAIAGAASCLLRCDPLPADCAGATSVFVDKCKDGYHRYKQSYGGSYKECLDDKAWCERPEARGDAKKTVWGRKAGTSERMICACEPTDQWTFDESVGHCVRSNDCKERCEALAQAGNAEWNDMTGLCYGRGINVNKIWDAGNCIFVDKRPEKTGKSEKPDENPLGKEVSRIKDNIRSIETGFTSSVWKNAEGNFNSARLVSDSVAGVVLGTAGGLITSSVIKKNQVKSGFEHVKCTIGGQVVADWTDEFQVGLNVAHKKKGL